ncbi:MAG: FAD-dependent oxidoreductase [Pseudomonadota bacterium]
MIRTVDQSKCIGCGTCQRICPLDVFRMDVKQPSTSPCTTACPIGNNIREIHYLMQMGSINEAATMMLANNPLASVTGRVCPRFCETECTRNQIDSAVNISAIEQYLGDYISGQDVDPVPRRHVAPIAVVGSGPAGLSCAYFLAADGFKVTVFEAKEVPGGMLRYGIPEYRLPSRVVGSIIERLQRMGVVFKCGQALNDTFTIKDLLADDFGAVFLGLGAGKTQKLQVDGLVADGVFSGLEFLEGIRIGHISRIAPKVVVLGGGNVGIDAAQSALRLGANSVTVVALEDEAGLPAYRHNVEAAKADGIDFVFSYGIEKIICKDGKVARITLVKCLSVYDEKGAFAPKFDKTDSREVVTQEVIIAIGQEVDFTSLPQEIVSPDGYIKASPDTCRTPIKKVFAGGDALNGPSSVAEAVGAGKRAAKAITYFLCGMDLELLVRKEIPVAGGLPENAQIKKVMRHGRVPFGQMGRKGFSELYRGFDLVETLSEVDRCLTCGAKSIAAYLDDCMTCFSCEINCPSGAIFVHPFKEILPRSLRPN